MKRLLLLEVKRIARVRSTQVLALIALILSIVMASLVVSFERYYYIDENGNEAHLNGIAAIRANRERFHNIEGALTPEKIREVFEIYHEVCAKYGTEPSDLPNNVYIERIIPIEPILYGIWQAYVDEETGVPIPMYTITPDMAADFYKKRTDRLSSFLSYKYENAPSVLGNALALNQTVKTPFNYTYGCTFRNVADYLTMYIFLLAMICAIITAPVFSGGYQSGADEILRCTKNGRWKLSLAKSLSSMLVAVTIYSICTFIFILITYTAIGWNRFDTSMQIAYSAISFAPLDVGDVNLLIILCGLLSLLAMICFTLFISAVFSKPSTSLTIALGTCSLPLILYIMGSNSTVATWIRLCLPSGGLGFSNSFFYELCDFNFLPFGSAYIWTPYIIPVASLVEIILFLLLTKRSYVKHEIS